LDSAAELCPAYVRITHGLSRCGRSGAGFSVMVKR
jgi:hypothetical protein